MNIFSEHSFKVILDYGHNPAAVNAMCQLVERMEVKGRRICVLAAPGDRRDEDIRNIAHQASGRFDFYICRRDDRLRGRESGEVPRILRDALIGDGVDSSKIKMIPSEADAVDFALRKSRPDDLLLIFGDHLSRCFKQVKNFVPGAEQQASASSPLPAKVEGIKVEEFRLQEGQRLIKDGRGVVLASGEESD